MSEYDVGLAAAVLYAVGVVVLFGLRSWQQKRTTGSTGFNGFRADRDLAARVAGLSFAAAALVGLVSPTLVLLGLLPLVKLGPVAAVIGLVLALAGFGLAVLAQQTMGRSWRIGVDPNERTDLVTQGVFRYVRNPIFTGMIAAQAGTVLLAPTWLALAGLAVLGAGIHLQQLTGRRRGGPDLGAAEIDHDVVATAFHRSDRTAGVVARHGDSLLTRDRGTDEGPRGCRW